MGDGAYRLAFLPKLYQVSGGQQKNNERTPQNKQKKSFVPATTVAILLTEQYTSGIVLLVTA